MPSEISQRREKQILYDLTYMWNLVKPIHRNRGQICGGQEWGLRVGERG